MRNNQRKCSGCKYRKWYGDYSLYYCELSGKVIKPYYYCDVEVMCVDNTIIESLRNNEDIVREITDNIIKEIFK